MASTSHVATCEVVALACVAADELDATTKIVSLNGAIVTGVYYVVVVDEQVNAGDIALDDPRSASY
jgi:hypothetical protein